MSDRKTTGNEAPGGGFVIFLAQEAAVAEWDAEVRWTPAQVAAALDARDTATTPHEAAAVAEGFDCAVFEVDGGDYVRVPRREVGVRDIEVERRALPLLAPRLSLAVPTPTSAGNMLDPPGWPWLRYRPVVGTDLASSNPASIDQGRLADSLGRFLAELHDPATLEVLRDVVPGDAWRRADMPYRVPRTLDLLDRLAQRDEGAGLPLARLRAFVEAAETVEARKDAVVHGDVHARHVLLDRQGEVSGVIDWGDVHLGDRAVDLRVQYALLDPPARARFEAAYGRRLDERERAVARVIAIYIDAVLLLSAVDFDVPQLVTAMRAGLSRAAR